MSESNNAVSGMTIDLDESQLEGLDEASRLELRMAHIETQLKSRETRRAGDLLAYGIAALGALFALFGRLLLPQQAVALSQYAPLIGVGITVYGLFLVFFARILRQNSTASLRAELDTLAARKRVLDQFSVGGVVAQTEDSYFDKLVRINVENLASYYALVKAHTEKSFLASLAVGAVGFLLLITGLIFGFVASDEVRAVSYIASGSGIVVEFIAGIFFYLYSRTVREMKGYHTSLLTVQNVLLAFKLVGDTKDSGEKAKMISQMLTYLIGQRVESPTTDNQLAATEQSNP